MHSADFEGARGNVVAECAAWVAAPLRNALMQGVSHLPRDKRLFRCCHSFQTHSMKQDIECGDRMCPCAVNLCRFFTTSCKAHRHAGRVTDVVPHGVISPCFAPRRLSLAVKFLLPTRFFLTQKRWRSMLYATIYREEILGMFHIRQKVVYTFPFRVF